jgi:hypothetical protein
MQDMPRSCLQADGQNDTYLSVVSNLMSLIEHIQASMQMLELAIAREVPAVDPEIYDNVILLDDVTPCYLEANAALQSCKAVLGAAVQSLLAGKKPGDGADGVAGREPRPNAIRSGKRLATAIAIAPPSRPSA